MRITFAFALGAVVAAPLLGSPAAALADAPLVHVRGTVAATSATGFDVTTATGLVHLTVAPKTGYISVLPSTRAAIKPNTFVGIASVGDAPGARAREVVVFPEAMRGAFEGHYGWDLPGGGNKMTNGNVAPAKSMMTNGSVHGATTGAGPMTITVTYKGGSNKITVPPDAPIVLLAPGTAKLLKAGAHVVVIAQQSGGKPTTAAAVLVGKDGLTPPM